MTISPAELEAAGLYDPDDWHAAERLELLQLLLDLGVTIEEMQEADELPILAASRAYRAGTERLTQVEVAARAGIPLEEAIRSWLVLGFADPGPEARIFSEADVEVMQTFQAAQQVFPRDVILQLGRVLGSTMARLADAAVSAFVVNLGAPSLASDPTGLSLARANVAAAALVPGLMRAMEVTLRHHLELARRPLVFADEGVQGVETQRLAVGFVDLVGSTALAQQLSMGELGAILGQFEAEAADAVAARGGRLVKLIGDEAMFVAGDAAIACEIALTVLDQVAASPNLDGARGGVGVGNVVTRDGDVFGPVVNLAARAVKLAQPGTVVVSAEARDSVEGRGGLRFTPLGPHHLKGFDTEVELHAVSR